MRESDGRRYVFRKQTTCFNLSQTAGVRGKAPKTRSCLTVRPPRDRLNCLIGPLSSGIKRRVRKTIAVVVGRSLCFPALARPFCKGVHGRKMYWTCAGSAKRWPYWPCSVSAGRSFLFLWVGKTFLWTLASAHERRAAASIRTWDDDGESPRIPRINAPDATHNCP